MQLASSTDKIFFRPKGMQCTKFVTQPRVRKFSSHVAYIGIFRIFHTFLCSSSSYTNAVLNCPPAGLDISFGCRLQIFNQTVNRKKENKTVIKRRPLNHLVFSFFEVRINQQLYSGGGPNGLATFRCMR